MIISYEGKKMKKNKTVKEDNVQENINVENQQEIGDFGLERENLSDNEYIEKLEFTLGEALKESMVSRGIAQRIQADFDNYRKRNSTISEDMKYLGVSLVVEKMLTVLDNCDLARKYIQDESALTGFNMMQTQIISALEVFGLSVIEAFDKEFNAKLMSAVETEKCDDKKDIVIEVLSKGYMLKDKVIRPASVKIGC